jgi:hypothetical protein
VILKEAAMRRTIQPIIALENNATATIFTIKNSAKELHGPPLEKICRLMWYVNQLGNPDKTEQSNPE